MVGSGKQYLYCDMVGGGRICYWSKILKPKRSNRGNKNTEAKQEKILKRLKKNRKNCWREIKYWSTSHIDCLRHSARYVKKIHSARCFMEALQWTTLSSGQVRGILLCQHLTPQNVIMDKVHKSKNVDFSGQLIHRAWRRRCLRWKPPEHWFLEFIDILQGVTQGNNVGIFYF